MGLVTKKIDSDTLHFYDKQKSPPFYFITRIIIRSLRTYLYRLENIVKIYYLLEDMFREYAAQIRL